MTEWRPVDVIVAMILFAVFVVLILTGSAVLLIKVWKDKGE